MADESMVRNLRAQAEAIWPQEEPIIRGHGGAGGNFGAAEFPGDILDVGCGTGEITSRLARLFSAAGGTGVDLIEPHLALARERYSDLADRVTVSPGGRVRAAVRGPKLRPRGLSPHAA